MRKIIAVASVALASTLFAGRALAQDGPPPPDGNAPPAGGATTPAAPADGTTAADDKKIGVGGDLQFVLPVDDFADGSGPLLGPVLRGGYRVMPPLELTLRVGFLFGFSKDRALGLGTVSVGYNLIPIHVGARYFFMEPQSGVYGAAEIGMNLLSPKAEVAGASVSGLENQTRFGANVGAGYVISRELPIDIRAQLMMLNLLGKESTAGRSENTLFGIGVSAGYTFQF